MYLKEDSLDDLLHGVYSSLLEKTTKIQASKGKVAEELGSLLQLTNPRARLSLSEIRLRPSSALAEFIWYLAGSDDPQFIGQYISKYLKLKTENGRVPGAYGPRMFGAPPDNQFQTIISLLKERPTTRRAVIPLFRQRDLIISTGSTSTVELLEVPCTCTLQFFVRDEKVHLNVHMRSNDAYLGLPHDVFCFTMLQELVARALSLELGEYIHSVGSLHLYEANFDSARQYLAEGWHEKVAMPSMPDGDQMPNASLLVKAEERIRAGAGEEVLVGLPSYWVDLGILLLTSNQLKSSEPDRYDAILEAAREKLTYPPYRHYLFDRQIAAADR